MIHFVVAVRSEDEKDFTENLKTTLKSEWFNNLYLITNDDANSIQKKYNLGVSRIGDKLSGDDVVCFIHSDVKIIDTYFEEKLNLVFGSMKQVGIAGVIGTNFFSEKGGWWLCDRKTQSFGHVIQGRPDLKESFHMVEGNGIGFFDDIVSVDGLCLFVRGDVLKKIKFDEETFGEGSWHQYDSDLCFQLLHETDYKVAVLDILLEHKSEGPLGEGWVDDVNKLRIKWENRNLMFPVTLDSFSKCGGGCGL